MGLIGLGGTNQCKGLIVEAVVVDKIEDIDKFNVSGKIVVFNYHWTNYGDTV